MNTLSIRPPFDTHKATVSLENAGLSNKQAEAVINLFLEVDATNSNTVATKGDIEKLESRLKSDMYRFIITVAGVQTAIIALVIALI